MESSLSKNKGKKKKKKTRKLTMEDYENDDLDLTPNKTDRLGQIKEEDDLNPNELKYGIRT